MDDETIPSVLSAEIDAAGSLVVTGGTQRHDPEGHSGRSTLRVKPARSTNRLLAIAILIVLGTAGLLTIWQDMRGAGGLLETRSGETIRARLEPAPPVAAVLYDTRNLPIAPESAIEINAERPADIRDAIPARAFTIGSAAANAVPRQTALECLAQAIYYEAASESEAGQRAVAQVVLNRVRSPAFPNTVCGVVYQGWTRTTGCQFSFTCDGSMQRAPSLSGMARARRIAGEALGGAVMREVGNATHYHADYVVPYWAGSLDKVKTVGRHIFYLIRGALGRPGAFTARYFGALEQSPFGALEEGGLDLAGAALPGAENAAMAGAAQAANPLAADLAMGKLIAPDGSALIAPTPALGRPTPGSAGAGLEPALKADAAGRIDAGTGSGRLIADERQGALRTQETPPTADPGSN